MSRNVDKANSVLVRYQEQQAEEQGGYKDYSRFKRPTRLNKVKDVKEAIEWRKQLVSEFKNKTTRIFDPALNETQIRELNEELNTLLKEKARWDWHIKNKLKSRAHDRFVPGGERILDKRYFGRAMELPEIQDQLKRKSATTEQLVNKKRIPADKSSTYYHSTVTPELTEFETQWSSILQKHSNSTQSPDASVTTIKQQEVPSIEQMEAYLVQRRKEKLLNQLSL